MQLMSTSLCLLATIHCRSTADRILRVAHASVRDHNTAWHTEGGFVGVPAGFRRSDDVGVTPSSSPTLVTAASGDQHLTRCNVVEK